MPKRKRYSVIYVPNADKIMYGNLCVLEETRKMGFEYLVETNQYFWEQDMEGEVDQQLLGKNKTCFYTIPLLEDDFEQENEEIVRP